MTLCIGLMSGTSMDGIDAALLQVETNQLITGITRPYSDEARTFLNDVLQADRVGLGTLAQLSTVLGREFAIAARQVLDDAEVSSEAITAIGSHGQTICHDAMADIPYTVQLGCPHTIAAMTGIQVVADFRTRDMVAGGQGAPFAPLYHQALFQEHAAPIAIINIGGIANITYLDALNSPRGFDIGPGNGLMDAWINTIHGKAYDKSGDWAASGQVITSLLEDLLSDPFFKQSPPKSIGKEYFSLAWLMPKWREGSLPEDVQATLLELTAVTIAEAVGQYNPSPSTVVICGGGVHNRALLHAIQRHLEKVVVKSSSAYGYDPDYIEAMMFAWLAHKRIHHTPVNLTALTGSKYPVVLGAIYPK